MAKCQFTTKYWDYQNYAEVDFHCDSKDEDILPSGFCMFHDKSYLRHGDNRKEHEQKVRDRLMAKVRNSTDKRESLFCIGYRLPDIRIREANFVKPISFAKCEFQGLADFSRDRFQGLADFTEAKFTGETADFGSAKFSGERAYFREVEFTGKIADFDECDNESISSYITLLLFFLYYLEILI